MKKILMLSSVLCACAMAQQPIQLQTVNGGTAVNLGHGTASGSIRVELPTDGTGIVGLASGSNTIGAVTQASGPWTINMTQVDGTNLGAPSNYGTSPGAVAVMGVNAFVTNAGSIGTPTPSTSSTYAFTRYHASSAAAANIKSSAGNLYGLVLGNNGTVPCYLQLFNNSGTPTAGTSVIDSIMVQAGLTVVVPANVLALENFATGIAAAGATSDSGSTTTGCTTTFSVSAYYE